MSFLLLVLQLWTRQPTEGALLSGNWQSCQTDGVYGEKIYDHHESVGGKVVWLWSLHMGPQHEFALYVPASDPLDVENHSHSGGANLLGPNFMVESEFNRGQRTWSFPKLGIWINIVRAGGSRDECESFFVLVRRHRW